MADISIESLTQLRLKKVEDGTIVYFVGRANEAIGLSKFGIVGKKSETTSEDLSCALDLYNPVKATLTLIDHPANPSP